MTVAMAMIVMKRILKTFLPGGQVVTLLSLFALAGCQQPAAEFWDVQGGGHRFDELQGQPLVVNYWATWCAPCIQEIPELNAFAEEQAGKVAVWGVNYDEPVGEEQARQVAKMKITFPVFRDNPSQALGVEVPQVLPTTLVFDAQGKLLATLVGPQTRETLLQVLPAE
jgi:thiol-disulfide isomerase/thioredoxin